MKIHIKTQYFLKISFLNWNNGKMKIDKVVSYEEDNCDTIMLPSEIYPESIFSENRVVGIVQKIWPRPKYELINVLKWNFMCHCCAILPHGDLISVLCNERTKYSQNFMEMAADHDQNVKFINDNYLRFAYISPRGNVAMVSRHQNIWGHYFGNNLQWQEEEDFIRRLHDTKKFAIAHWYRFSDRENARELDAMVGEQKMILPPDIFETGYIYLPLVIQRWCKKQCKQCTHKHDYKLFEQQEINQQLEFYLKKYPKTTMNSVGLLLWWEDALSHKTDIIVNTIKEVSKKIKFIDNRSTGYERENLFGSASLKNIWNQKWFVYLFGSAPSILSKSDNELSEINQAWIRILNLWVESFDDEYLRKYFNKTSRESLSALEKLEKNWIPYSINLFVGEWSVEEQIKHLDISFQKIKSLNIKKIYIAYSNPPIDDIVLEKLKSYENIFNIQTYPQLFY